MAIAVFFVISLAIHKSPVTDFPYLPICAETKVLEEIFHSIPVPERFCLKFSSPDDDCFLKSNSFASVNNIYYTWNPIVVDPDEIKFYNG